MTNKRRTRTERSESYSDEYDFKPTRWQDFVTPGAFLLGLIVISFGIGTCGVSRWGDGGHLAPHLWFAPIGIALIAFGLWRHGKGY